jgi:hypothetical protein
VLDRRRTLVVERDSTRSTHKQSKDDRASKAKTNNKNGARKAEKQETEGTKQTTHTTASAQASAAPRHDSSKRACRRDGVAWVSCLVGSTGAPATTCLPAYEPHHPHPVASTSKRTMRPKLQSAHILPKLLAMKMFSIHNKHFCQFCKFRFYDLAVLHAKLKEANKMRWLAKDRFPTRRIFLPRPT